MHDTLWEQASKQADWLFGKHRLHDYNTIHTIIIVYIVDQQSST